MIIKKGKLDDVEKFYIKYHLDMNSKKLARLLHRSVRQVNQEKNRYKNQQISPDEIINDVALQEDKEENAKSNIIQKDNVDELMGKHMRNGQIVATVMTPNASERSDMTRDSRVKVNKRTNQSIHRPKG